jgi:hypothetical protein
MDGGLTAAALVSPLHHLRTAEILSKRWGPPQMTSSCHTLVCLEGTLQGLKLRVRTEFWLPSPVRLSLSREFGWNRPVSRGFALK